MTETTLAAANTAIIHDKRRNMTRLLEVIDDAAAKGAALPRRHVGSSPAHSPTALRSRHKGLEEVASGNLALPV